jgi:hypothetical protein
LAVGYPHSFGLSATSQQYFSLGTKQPPATSQQYFSLRTNQHQPSATSHPNRLTAFRIAALDDANKKRNTQLSWCSLSPASGQNH